MIINQKAAPNIINFSRQPVTFKAILSAKIIIKRLNIIDNTPDIISLPKMNLYVYSINKTFKVQHEYNPSALKYGCCFCY